MRYQRCVNVLSADVAVDLVVNCLVGNVIRPNAGIHQCSWSKVSSVVHGIIS